LGANSQIPSELITLLARYGLQPFLETTHTLVALLDSNGLLTSWNPAFETVQGSPPLPFSFKELLSPNDKVFFERSIKKSAVAHTWARASLKIGQPPQSSGYNCLIIPIEDGRTLLIAEPALDLNSKVEDRSEDPEKMKTRLHEFEIALEDKQKELRAVIAQADEISHTDTLTLLPNRLAIISELQRQVTTSERYGTPLTISILDLDHFKEVNDTYGHAAGDAVLRFIALGMRDHIRQPDLIGRYAGDEFLALLPNSTLRAASEQAARLCQQVRALPIVSGKHMISMTLSVGIAQYKIHEEDWQKLLDRADQALYLAKRNGRDQWAILEA
jgi:diguanylate cyclase (GGDEF)-like protein